MMLIWWPGVGQPSTGVSQSHTFDAAHGSTRETVTAGTCLILKMWQLFWRFEHRHRHIMDAYTYK